MMSAPSEQHAARALTLAAESTGEDVEKLFADRSFSRARLVALAALQGMVGTNGYVGFARLLNFAEPERAASLLINARRRDWWREGVVDEIVGELVADQYGSQAQ